MLRVKLRVTPYEEKLCILTPINSTVHELKTAAIDALQAYTLYQEQLSHCGLHLELEIDDACYGVADHYAVKDVYTDRDTFVVSFIEHKDLMNRPSIHMRLSTSKSDVTITAGANNKQRINVSRARVPQVAVIGPLQSVHLSTNNLAEIQQWISNELRTFGTIHAIYRCDYASFIAKLQTAHNVGIQSILQQNSDMSIETFLSRFYDVHCVETATQHWIEWEIPSEAMEPADTGSNENRNDSNEILKHGNQNENNEKREIENENENENVTPRPSSFCKQSKTRKRDFDSSELPATPSSASDHEDEDEDEDEDGEDENQEDTPQSNESGNDDDEKIGELNMPNQQQFAEPSESEAFSMGSSMATTSTTMFDSLQLREALPQILWLSYSQLVAEMKARRVPWRLAKYVEMSALERAIKCKFRENTVYEFSASELDYVCFRQLLQLECPAWAWMEVQVVECHAQLMDDQRAQYYGAELEHAIENADDPAEIATFVVIRATKNVRKHVQVEELDNLDNLDDDDDDYDDHDNAEILRDIEYLKQCNVVHKMSANDVYFHIKLMHCTRSVTDLQLELNTIEQNQAMANQAEDLDLDSMDALEQVAHKLRANGVDGACILNMKWSSWEELSKLNRSNSDHQDFVEDVVLDFFFPFNIGEQLLNQIVSLRKPPLKREHGNTSRPTSIFDNAQIRRKFSLCLDYALYDQHFPVLQCLVKLSQFEDMQFLLQVHKHLSVDRVVGPYNSMHIAAWKGKFKLLAAMTMYGGNPLITNNEEETALEAGRKYPAKLKWFVTKYPKFAKYLTKK